MLAKFCLVLTLFLFFGNPIEERKEYQKDYYDTGQLKAEGWMAHNSKTGYWKFYHPNGRTSEKGHYKNDQRVNYWYFYGENGKLQQEGHYTNGKMANWWLFYDNNGKVNHKCQLSDGKKNGYCLKYMDEKLTSAEKYKNGKKIKEWFSFRSFRSENKLSDLK